MTKDQEIARRIARQGCKPLFARPVSPEEVSACDSLTRMIEAALANERGRCAQVAEKTSGFVSVNQNFERGYDAGRADAAKAIRNQ